MSPDIAESGEEEILVAGAVQGDAEAFGCLYDRYLEPIYRHIFYRVADHAEAEDLTETVFLKAWTALPRVRPKQMRNFRAWLYRIAHNTVMDFYRTRRPALPLEHASTRHNTDPTPELGILAQEESMQLALALSQLKPALQQVLICRFVSGLSHKETARITGLSEGNVRVLQHRALKKMRTLLNGLGF